MKLNFTKKISLVLAVVTVTSFSTKAQELGGMSNFLKAGSEDASVLMGNYLNPLFTGFGYGVANGWYNTAKAHKSLGFDLTVTVNAAYVPDDQLFFDIIESDYQNLTLVDPNLSNTSTLFGDATNTNVLSTYTETIDGQDYNVSTEFPTPEGLSLDESFNGIVPTPMIQLGVGIIKNTDLKIRWMPTITDTFDGNDFSVSMFGVGVMHDFKQWIPAIKHIPIDMAVLVAYNRIGMETELAGALPGENQTGEIYIDSWTYQLLISKKLSVLTVYGGFGFNDTYTNLSVLGDYEVADDRGDGQPLVLTDPIDETYTSSGMRGTLGMRLKLAIITLHTDYTFQEYNTLTVGLGISLR
ncbi:MAG: hypothetical protein OCD76_09270 [Reichenbachiella sp.]